MFYKKIAYDECNIVELITTNKVVHFTDCPPFSEKFFLEIADKIGKPIPINENIATGNKDGDLLMDVRYDKNKSDVFRHSNTAQQLHTDASYESDTPDIVFFYCVEQASNGGDTLFLDSVELLESLNDNKELLGQLKSVDVEFRKGDDFKRRPIISCDQKGVLLTWNYYRVIHTSLNKEMITKFVNHLDAIKNKCFCVNLKPNEMLLFQDERLLHGREAFIGDRFMWKGGIKSFENIRN